MTIELRPRDPSFNLKCKACIEERLHTPQEKAEFHPLMGHGYLHGHGWTHPDLEPKAIGAAS